MTAVRPSYRLQRLNDVGAKVPKYIGLSSAAAEFAVLHRLRLSVCLSVCQAPVQFTLQGRVFVVGRPRRLHVDLASVYGRRSSRVTSARKDYFQGRRSDLSGST